ncbi:ABC transporter ATP-binding protein [Actimicrobium sp. CCC2.4]|uniref:ABC transporter ATP-binding protein n=1 Tax=Actimicrobium sp. CCC2.4 TaxID=3048606 RepID=UPI002AC94DE5|nr:ABC transporter ATP-binding protein [Actimicrobium sp. CCC2.4]MEB0134821.1 ABC transporter ATP-binding protein [Actimicrobium sp. CCC2.4]WPX30759.1 ABC transporter ATP-binding protein [Actimicrobium sp. CCC2.4]
MALLELQDVTYAYGAQKVVEELSLRLAPGAIGCLLGPSGCGKTTVLRCIAGFETVSGGTIRVAGEVLSGPASHVPAEQRRIGMVFQDYALFPHLTVAANIGFGLRGLSASARQARVLSLLGTVGLAGQDNKFPHELSGGQQQRVALARALAPRPRLLLLDEPFSNLDVELRERLALEVRSILAAEGTTAILVTHDQHEAFTIADEIGIMHEGRIQQWDTPYNLYHQPANRFVADFVGQGVFLPGEVISASRIEIELGILSSEMLAGGNADAIARKVGKRVTVLLRPDDVVHDDASLLQAEVLAKAFRGAEFLYTLRLASGAQVLSLVPSHHDHAIGERIGIRLDVDHVVVFRAEQ